MADHPVRPPGLLRWLTTTDHKDIGILYMVTSGLFFAVAGLLAMVMRAELTQPGLQLVDRATYNELFTMHGTAMIFFFATPMVVGLANYLLPLQIGASDVAYPRLNALTYWLFVMGGLIVFSGFLTSGGAASFGWTGYAPLNQTTYSPQVGTDLWIAGLFLSGISTILGSINFIATIYGMRAPGMSLLRMPIFTWNMLVTSVLILFTFPVLSASLGALFIDRAIGGHLFDPAQGGDPILWQHLFWFFGHPEVYIIVLPFFGIVTEIIPVFSRKPVFGYRGFVFATMLIAFYSFAVWAHHMFTTGAVNNLFFTFTSFLIAVPTGVKFFNWIATMWRGKLTFQTPMLFCMGFLFMFLIGGVTGIFLASPPIDYGVHDTYYVVAHFHYTIFGGSVFAMFAGIYFWMPKFSGRMMSEGLGKLHFWMMIAGFNMTFFPMHQMGINGMVRRVPNYPPGDGLEGLNLLSTIGSVLLALSLCVFVANLVRSARRGKAADDDPWGANSLEWATSSPPPMHNFRSLPPIRSERPVFDARHPSQAVAKVESVRIPQLEDVPVALVSLQPVFVAIGAAAICTGLVFGAWLWLPGALIVLGAGGRWIGEI
jgi:cytochrome c oxidase subunit 1